VIKNSHLFWKKCQKTAGVDFFDSHCTDTFGFHFTDVLFYGYHEWSCSDIVARSITLQRS